MNMKTVTSAAVVLCAAVPAIHAQHAHDSSHAVDSTRIVGVAEESMSGAPSDFAMRHIELSPARVMTPQDSARAMDVAARLRLALAKYADTSAAVADGYRMFAPRLKQQRIYHFTNYRNAFMEAFRFDPEKPTSILYRRAADGRLEIVGAMYTAPKRAPVELLDERVPLSVARWHKHVNWCVPARGESDRWFERREDVPVFGPQSPIATRAECDAVNGRFLESPLGWMIHVNVFAGDELGMIFAHSH
jgi:hypothetical protein